MNLKIIFEKYKDVIPYLFFGICTTVVNVASYWICAHLLNLGIMTSTITAWILAVLFAYFTNRKWVFHSEAQGIKRVLKEVVSFFSCRLLTGVVDWSCMFVLVDLLLWNDVFVKVAANILVIILNYVASKMIIFKKR